MLNLIFFYISFGFGFSIARLRKGDADIDMQAFRDNNDEIAVMLDGMNALLSYSFINTIYIILWVTFFTLIWPVKAWKLIK